MEPAAEPPRGSGGTSLRPDDGRLLRGQRSRARIRQAARSLFHEVGFDRTTLRAIAARAGMGASSIYRHIRSKEELLVEELWELQEEAWRAFRAGTRRELPVRERVRKWLETEHEILARETDFTTVALRATTHPEARVARRVLALQDRTVGLLAEILQAGRTRGELGREVDVVAAARTLHHATQGVRIAWANGLLDGPGCRSAIDSAAQLLFDGIAGSGPLAPPAPPDSREAKGASE